MDDEQKVKHICCRIFPVCCIVNNWYHRLLNVGVSHVQCVVKEMGGRAELAEAEWTKKVAVETAKAKRILHNYLRKLRLSNLKDSEKPIE